MKAGFSGKQLTEFEFEYVGIAQSVPDMYGISVHCRYTGTHIRYVSSVCLRQRLVRREIPRRKRALENYLSVQVSLWWCVESQVLGR